MSEKKLWWLHESGLDVHNNSGTEWVCTCPFCGDERDHFYFNSQTLLYHCKKCGAKGNYLPLMAQLAMNLAEEFDEEALATLADNRLLPTEAFDGCDFGWTGRFFTLPIRDGNNTIMNVQRYAPGGKLLSVPGCKIGLFGAQHLAAPKRKDEPVYLAEGPWDAIAFEWLRHKVKRKGIVTAVLGAGQLPDLQVGLFKSREVFIIHDNDDAGAKGEARIVGKLTGVAKSLAFFQWTEDDDTGMDIRDIITREI